MKSYVVMFILALCYCLAGQAQIQQPPPESRRLVLKVSPEYPEAARRMGLGGTVKVIAVVGPDGKVKKVETVGGSPLLVQAAQRAVAQWKYTPGGETQESVELHFTP